MLASNIRCRCADECSQQRLRSTARTEIRNHVRHTSRSEPLGRRSRARLHERPHLTGLRPGSGGADQERRTRRRRRDRGGRRIRQGRLPRVARHLHRAPSADHLRVPRVAERPQGRAGRDPDRGARKGSQRCGGRDHARPRGGRTRDRVSAPAERGVLRERVDRGRRLLHEAAAGCGGHHLSLQLPRDGADVVLPDRHRGGQHGRTEAQSEKDPSGRHLDGQPASRRLACPTACSTCVHGDKESRGCPARAPRGCEVHLVRRDRHPIAKYIYETAAKQRQARAGPRRSQEPHARAARRGPRPRSPTRRSTRASARPANAAWRSRCVVAVEHRR